MLLILTTSIARSNIIHLNRIYGADGADGGVDVRPSVDQKEKLGNSNDSNSHHNTTGFNFVAAGDFGCGAKANRTVTNMQRLNPELVIALGDLSYQKSPDCWFQVVSPLDKDGKLKIEFGEHDVDDNLTKYNAYIKHFNMTNPYYSFNYQNVHFLAMATGKAEIIPYDNSSKQYQFVKDDLKNAHKNKDIDWIIVYSFRPFYSSNSTHPGLDLLQDTYHPLFDKYGVDLVLQAHNHNYQRTYPLSYNYTLQSTPTITDKHTRDYSHNPKGAIYVIAGTGGQDFYNLTSKSPYVVTQFLRHGFLNVDVSKNQTVTNLTTTFFDNRDMKDKDHFSIIKELK